MILDRQLQLELLEKLRDTYPKHCDLDKDYQSDNDNYKKATSNLYYLMQHGLVSEKSLLISSGLGGHFRMQFGSPTITHRGLDFLADDGGLSAILGVVTIKFEADQLKLLLESKIMASNLPPESKQSMIDVLRELPAESIKHLTTKIVDTGYDNLDSLMNLIQNSLF
ncbi:hypothetical protein PY247_10670 [Acinetobacter proteolyticus]|nr:hypothetical protein [Acinetobacter proteolyticus]WEI20136.1 hypothetical protein PY247_10670 [Acinetobacter proteolyticus]